MKLYDNIMVNASASIVWKILSDPNLMELWNPKCLQSNAGKGPFGVGYAYNATFKLGRNPERIAQCIIEEYEPNQLIKTKYSGDAFKRQGYVKETYLLAAKRNGTKIYQTIDFARSEIPFIILLICKIISTFGYKAGKGPLDKIKELAENEEQLNSLK